MRPRLTYGNAVATLALFIALGGTALAASHLGANSVGTKQLKNNSVTGAKVKNGSLAAVDFGSDQLPRGAQGERGERGERGAPGSARAYAFVNAGKTPSFDPRRTKGFTAVSHAGTGVYCLTPEAGIDISASAPAVTPVYESGLLEPEFALPSPNFSCPSAELEVTTYIPGAPITQTDAISFTVVVP